MSVSTDVILVIPPFSAAVAIDELPVHIPNIIVEVAIPTFPPTVFAVATNGPLLSV